MLGLLFLLISTVFGFSLAGYFRLLRKNVWLDVCIAFLVGTIFSSWLVFILTLAFGWHPWVIALSEILLAGGAFLIETHLLPEERLLSHLRSSEKEIATLHLLTLLCVLPFFMGTIWENRNGDIRFSGNGWDVPYHLSIVQAFSSQGKFPIETPQSAGHLLCYHFMADFHSAILHLGGMPLLDSIILPNVIFAMCLATFVWLFFSTFLRSKTAQFFSVLLFLFAHIGVFNLAFAALGIRYPDSPVFYSPGHALEEFFSRRTYFLSPLVNLFQPQRPFLLVFPLILVVIILLRDGLVRNEPRVFWGVCLLVGLLPLFHIHSFLVLAPTVALVVLFRFGLTSRRLLPLAAMIFAIPQLWYILSLQKPDYYSGWDATSLHILPSVPVLAPLFIRRILYWIGAAGFPFILGGCGLILSFKKWKRLPQNGQNNANRTALSALGLVSFIFFCAINYYRFTPNWGDSNKFFLYLHLILSLYSGLFLARLYRTGPARKTLAVLTIIAAALGPGLVAISFYMRDDQMLFSACDRKTAEWIQNNTLSHDIFLTAPGRLQYVPALSGRRVVDGVGTFETGHQTSSVMTEVREMYQIATPALFRKYAVKYAVLGPHEYSTLQVNPSAFEPYRVAFHQTCGGNEYAIYDVTNHRPR